MSVSIYAIVGSSMNYSSLCFRINSVCKFWASPNFEMLCFFGEGYRWVHMWVCPSKHLWPDQACFPHIFQLLWAWSNNFSLLIFLFTWVIGSSLLSSPMVHARHALHALSFYDSPFSNTNHIAMRAIGYVRMYSEWKGSIDNDPSSAETNSVVQQAATKRPHSD